MVASWLAAAPLRCWQLGRVTEASEAASSLLCNYPYPAMSRAHLLPCGGLTREPPYDQRHTIAGREHQPCDRPSHRARQQALQNGHNEDWTAADDGSDDDCKAKFRALVPQPR